MARPPSIQRHCCTPRCPKLRSYPRSQRGIGCPTRDASETDDETRRVILYRWDGKSDTTRLENLGHAGLPHHVWTLKELGGILTQTARSPAAGCRCLDSSHRLAERYYAAARLCD